MDEQHYFSAKIEDLIRRESRGEGMVFSSFLSPEECVTAERICKRSGAPYILYGGHPEGERKMLAVSAYDPQILFGCFPIVLLKLSGNDLSLLSHRDVLGALMGAGIRRELIGDIIVRDGIAAFFAVDHIAEFLIQNVTSVGRQTVKIQDAPLDFVIPPQPFEELRITVASLRVDAVVGGLCRCSREQATRLIEGKFVMINHIPVDKKTKEIHPGDCIVVRGSGKWIVDQCGELTKKGRAVLRCRKYN